MNQRHTNAPLSQEMSRLNVKWVIVGSISLVLQGVSIRPKGIDILTTKRGAYASNKQLKLCETRPVRFGKLRKFQFYLGEFKVGGVKVQVMGELKVRVGGKWISRASRLKNPQIVWLRGRRLLVTPLRIQLESYKALSRRKSVPKIRKTEIFLTTPRPFAS